jgi:hypothetical protein
MPKGLSNANMLGKEEVRQPVHFALLNFLSEVSWIGYRK